MPELDKSSRFRTAPASYAYATAIFGVAMLLRLVLVQAILGIPYVTFYPAVVAAYFLCGMGPGHWVTALSTVAGVVMLIQQDVSELLQHALALAIFLSCAALIGWIARQFHMSSELLRSTRARLRKEEALHQLMVEAQTDPVIRASADGTVVYVNEAFCRLFGVERAEIMGRVWKPSGPDQAAPCDRESLAALSPDKPVVHTERRIASPSGESVWVQFANCASFDETGRLLEVQSVGRDITERKRLDAEAAMLSCEWQDLYENSPAGHLSLDVGGKFIRVNQTALGWLGCSRADLIGKKTLVDFLSSQGRHLFRNIFPKLKHLGYADDMQFDLCSLDGTVRRVTMASTTIRSADDNFLATRSVMNDVTEVELLRQHLAQAALEQSALLDNELIGMFKLRERCFVWLNRTGEQMLGYTQKELLGQSTRMLYVDHASFEEVGRLAAMALEAGKSCRTEVQLVRKDGSIFWADISGANMTNGTGDTLWLLVDATQTRLANEQIARLAHHDALTGLPNRLLLGDRLAQAKPLALRDGSQLAVCFLDLDGFKAVNDLHGHEAGDELLKEVAARLLQAVRANDSVCRLGGDEFVLLLNQLTRPDEHLDILKRATTALCQPVVLSSGAVVQVTTSVGVSFFPRHTVDTTELIRLADHAMYEAKKAGRNRIVTYEP